MNDAPRGIGRLGKRLALLAVALPALFLLGTSSASAAPAPHATTHGASLECAGPCPIFLFKKGNGSGRVTSTPSGLDCGSVCNTTLDDSSGIILSATVSSGSRLDRWQGCPDTQTHPGACYIPPGSGGLGLSICATFVSTGAPSPGPEACPPDAAQPTPPPAPPPDPRPNTRITSGPPLSTRSRRATFRFTASERRVTYLCKLDRRPWLPCRAPKAYARLRPGTHTFRVRAIDNVGQLDPTPAARRWRVRA
jgi:hypothetical protein